MQENNIQRLNTVIIHHRQQVPTFQHLHNENINFKIKNTVVSIKIHFGKYMFVFALMSILCILHFTADSGESVTFFYLAALRWTSLQVFRMRGCQGRI